MSNYREPYLHEAKYYETDQMAVVHHSNYIRWFEEARIAWLGQVGMPYHEMEANGVVIPVIGVSVEYKSMTRFSETVEIHCRLEQYNSVRFAISYEVRDHATGELRATGSSQHCFLNRDYQPMILRRGAPAYDKIFKEIFAQCKAEKGE